MGHCFHSSFFCRRRLPRFCQGSRWSHFPVGASHFTECCTSRKEWDRFRRSFTTTGALPGCLAKRHSKHSVRCSQDTDGCSLDPTGEAKALVLRPVHTSVIAAAIKTGGIPAGPRPWSAFSRLIT